MKKYLNLILAAAAALVSCNKQLQEHEQGCIFHFSNYRGDLISMCVSSQLRRNGLEHVEAEVSHDFTVGSIS